MFINRIIKVLNLALEKENYIEKIQQLLAIMKH